MCRVAFRVTANEITRNHHHLPQEGTKSTHQNAPKGWRSRGRVRHMCLRRKGGWGHPPAPLFWFICGVKGVVGRYVRPMRDGSSPKPLAMLAWPSNANVKLRWFCCCCGGLSDCGRDGMSSSGTVLQHVGEGNEGVRIDCSNWRRLEVCPPHPSSGDDDAATRQGGEEGVGGEAAGQPKCGDDHATMTKCHACGRYASYELPGVLTCEGQPLISHSRREG